MTRYDAYLTLHVFAAIIWLGGLFMSFTLSLKAARSADPAEGGRVGQMNMWLAPRVFIPSALVVLASGLLMIVDGPWGLDIFWIAFGLIGFAVAFLTGILFLKPESNRIVQAVAQHGPRSPEAARHVRRITIASRLVLVLVFAIAANMLLKPTGDDVWLLAVGAFVVAAAAVAVFVTAPRPAAPEAALAPATD